MITCLEGIVKEIDGHLITIAINGVGYGVNVLKNDFLELNTEIMLYIRMCWHQEEGPQLYGFKEKNQRIIFDLIIGCSGFGPKIALTALESMNPSQFISAILERDSKALSSISGIGTKKAEVMILQLKDKAAKLIDGGFVINNPIEMNILKDLSPVLVSLGYSQKEIGPAIDYARKELSDTPTFDECLRKALSYLSKS